MYSHELCSLEEISIYQKIPLIFEKLCEDMLFWRKKGTKPPLDDGNTPLNVVPYGDLACENAIIKEHARFGRVRTALMRKLRGKYGKQVANRAMWRVEKRLRDGFLNGDTRKDAEKKAMNTAKRLRPISEIAHEETEESHLQNSL